MEFGDLITQNGCAWLVIGRVDHEFTVRDLEICDFGAVSSFTPEVGSLVVMALSIPGYTRGFVSQLPGKKEG